MFVRLGLLVELMKAWKLNSIVMPTDIEDTNLQLYTLYKARSYSSSKFCAIYLKQHRQHLYKLFVHDISLHTKRSDPSTKTPFNVHSYEPLCRITIVRSLFIPILKLNVS